MTGNWCSLDKMFVEKEEVFRSNGIVHRGCNSVSEKES